MGKFINLQTDVFSIFNSNTWKAENIKTFPVNFIPINHGNEFIRVNIVGSGSGINLKSISGVIIVDIFTSAGNGPNQAYLIADKLEQYLVGKSVKTQIGAITQFFGSSLETRGLDKDNPSLFRLSYTVPFNYFGVQ